MSTDERRDRAPTRREYLTYGGAAVGGGLLAGCTGGDAESTPAGDGNESPATNTGDRAAGDSNEQSHTATLSPAREVTFDGVPERVFTVYPQYLDMAVALGHADAVNAVYSPRCRGRR